jgi:hypothetical protein
VAVIWLHPDLLLVPRALPTVTIARRHLVKLMVATITTVEMVFRESELGQRT